MRKLIRLDSSFKDRDRQMFASGQLMPGFISLNKKSATNAEVFIYGDIGGWYDGITADQFCQDLSGMDVEQLDVRINSGGGLINEGIAIYNALVRHKAKVTMTIDGMAASIASVIAMAGDEISICEGARMMIHDPWAFAMGNAEEMRKEAEVLDGFKDDIVDLYAARTDRNRPDLEKMMSDETWMSAREAVDHGFADSMVDAKKKTKCAASALMKLYHAPVDMLGQGTVTARDIEEQLHDSGGFSKTQSRSMAFAAMNKISGSGRWDAVPLPRCDAGDSKGNIDDFEGLATIINHISCHLTKGPS